MYEIAQNGVNVLRLRTRTLRKRYTDFTQLLTQNKTISGLCSRNYALTNLVMKYPGFAVPLIFASNFNTLIVFFFFFFFFLQFLRFGWKNALLVKKKKNVSSMLRSFCIFFSFDSY